MKLQPLNIGNIQLKYPIIQGGMGVGISLSSLASAVTLAGGLGVISSAQIGYKDENFSKNAFECNIKAFKEHITLAKEKVKDKPIGVNIMAVTHKYEEYVKCAISSGADIVISGAGLPVSLPSLVKGTKTKFAPIVSSLRATSLLFKMWEKRDNTTCDMVIVENHLAGGHLGFKEDQIKEYLTTKNFDDEFKDIVNYVKTFEEKYNKKIPVIYAGGVYDREDFMHCMDIGADGVQIGTRFVTTTECDASQEFKNAYINANEEDIFLVKSPVGLPGRAIINEFTTSTKREPITKCYKCLDKCDFRTTPYCISDRLIKAVNGNIKDSLIFCGAKAYKCDKIVSVEEVFEALLY
ncbi:MAG: NAD(P)H-dependent flavin oxidoreductase [Lachnospirales bacterium]